MGLTLHSYQKAALKWLIRETFLKGRRGAALWMDPGLGKTITTLAWLKLARAMDCVSKTLIVSSPRVVQDVWPAEIDAWEKFDFSYTLVEGTPAKREKLLHEPTDIHLMSVDSLNWLKKLREADKKRTNPNLYWDALIVDESSKFRSWTSQRTLALRKLLYQTQTKKRDEAWWFDYVIGLTGTPTANTLLHLFPQIWMLDQAECLGVPNITQFKEKWFIPDPFIRGKVEAKPDVEGEIMDLCRHLVFRIDGEEELKLPECIVNDVLVKLPKAVKTKYNKLHREMKVEIEEKGLKIVAKHAGSKYNLCRQFANGSVYDRKGEAHQVHKAKLNALGDLIDELQGKPLLILHPFTSDINRFRELVPKMPGINSETTTAEFRNLCEDWNAGRIPVMSAQCQGVAHGLNLQKGGCQDVAWFGVPDDLDIYLQGIKRVHRQGVSGKVRVHRFLTEGTVDEDIIKSLYEKGQSQDKVLESAKK